HYPISMTRNTSYGIDTRSVERFNRTLLDEFFRVAFREKFHDSVEGLQKDLDKYLRFYNTERPHQGYRNMGKRPVDTVEKFVKSSRKKASCTVRSSRKKVS
ncbi:MAG: integrase core domain-containing protein, partial [Nitrospinota bacterium]